ncbi:hypothetical protein GCM10028771_00580 [Nocardioides marmoraquaticus]
MPDPNLEPARQAPEAPLEPGTLRGGAPFAPSPVDAAATDPSDPSPASSSTTPAPPSAAEDTSGRGARLVRRVKARSAEFLLDERTRKVAQQGVQLAALATAAVVTHRRQASSQRAAREAIPDTPAWAAEWAAAEAALRSPKPPETSGRHGNARTAPPAAAARQKPWLDALDNVAAPEADEDTADQPDDAWRALTPSPQAVRRELAATKQRSDAVMNNLRA